jgi:ApeA N-terminal domain 1
VQTETTKFEAWNSVSYKWPSVIGIHLDNVIRLRLEFRKPVKLADAISAGFDFRCFCELLTVGPHCLSDMKIEHKDAKENEGPISLVMSYGDKPTDVTDLRRHSLIAAGSNPNEFERVLTNWISNQTERRFARLRLIQGLREEKTFSIDRLVAAANAFDLLPFESKPLPAQVQSNVADLKKSVRRSLPSPYREPILDALGRLKGSNLRSKILARFEILPESLRSKLAEMETIIGYCVQARNYFVHGTRPTKLSPKAIEEYLVFFTQTLEFIFIVAELSECGWTSKSADSRWFWTYLENYRHGSKQLKDELT